ncbi:apolipoprotein C-I [Sceloporus undulatus]|uniref:apolipoprotein C-I n=1 Tax=Sceloporus undulatus TaxID=8520 RepID=UPI001C4A89CE|nr:apolipoprotein C-I [Sceloporus undulatus]XP_042296565.1 apolipoprotein C-I [Sceloporus undulatus]
MQIVVSVAVVLAALTVVADSEVQTVTEPTLSQKFERFQHDVQTFVDRFGEKTKAAFQGLHQSEISNKTRSWFSETFQKLKEKFRTPFSREEPN